MSLMAQVRRERLGRLATLPPGTGLEIGPLADPLVLRGEHDVRYVDVLDEAGLRKYYRDDPSVEGEAISAVDYSLTGPAGRVTLAEAVREGAPYAYVVACHVLEHVPDVVGWFADVAAVLADDGMLLLVVPDKRYCFDYYRQQTSVGQLLQAAHARERVPSVRAVYDHFRDAVHVSVPDTWRGVLPGDLPSTRLYPLEKALAALERACAGHYVDCHVWTFTPEVFVDQLAELAVLGLCDFTVEALLPTPEDALEFYAVLRRVDPTADETTRRRLVAQATQRARVALDAAAQPPDGRVEAERERVRLLEAQVEDLRVRNADLAAQEGVLRPALAAVRAELAEVKQSERWRVGGALVAPLSGARRRLARGPRRRR